MLRHRSVEGIGLRRTFSEVSVDGHVFRVKLVERPGGPTAKVESDDLSPHEQHARRSELRRRAEALALSRHAGPPDRASPRAASSRAAPHPDEVADA